MDGIKYYLLESNSHFAVILKIKSSLTKTVGEKFPRKKIILQDHVEIYDCAFFRCESSTEPGFFRMGNLSEPYPECCPQKIS